MIYYFTPYSLEKNIGKSYNNYCNLVPNDSDWICLVDADVMFLTHNFGHQLNDIIEKYPNVGLFTCYTNRIGNSLQLYNNEFSKNPNILYHREIAKKLQKENYFKLKPLHQFISGHLMMFKKQTWLDVNKFDEEGMLTIDNKFSYRVKKNGKQIMLMEGVYVFHYYRMEEGKKYKEHLK